MGLNLHNKNLDFLFKAVLALENVEECYDFFEDLCTVQELNAISQRIVVGKDAVRKMRIYGYCQRDRCVYRHHQPGEPLFAVWLRWV